MNGSCRAHQHRNSYVAVEILEVPELGGEIEIRGLGLGAFLELYGVAAANGTRAHVAPLLAGSVFGAKANR
jgi:hypothetical protein